MNPGRCLRPAAALAMVALLSGCAAAAIPIVAGGMIARQATSREHEDRGSAPAAPATTAVVPASGSTEDGSRWIVTGMTEMPAPDAAARRPMPAEPVAEPASASAPDLRRSGEAAALSIQSYQILWQYVFARSVDRQAGEAISGAVLARGATLAAPRFVPCGTKPLAVIFDIDDTVLQSGGGGALPVAVPGAADTIAQLRRRDIAVVFNADRPASEEAATIAALDAAGLGPVERGSTLWLRGDGDGAGKDARRWAIAERYCVVALVGDRLGDFTDLFDAAAPDAELRRTTASETMVAPMWGMGWFMLPNPLAGAAPAADAAPETDLPTETVTDALDS